MMRTEENMIIGSKVFCWIITFLFLVAGIFFAISSACAEVDQKPQQFEVVYTVTYNSITLAEAAKIEKKIKKQQGKAFGVGIEINDINNIAITPATSELIIDIDTIDDPTYLDVKFITDDKVFTTTDTITYSPSGEITLNY